VEVRTEGRNTPVKLAAESFIRQGAGLKNYLWLDSQDIAGVEKKILKQCPVWILGVQRERNEIKTTLDNIPASVRKPKGADIATLGVGQFFACWGTHAVKTYVQPMWMNSADAAAIAVGRISIADAATLPRRSTEEQTVKESEARALRDTNARQAQQINELREKLTYAFEQIEKLEGHAPSSSHKMPESAPASGYPNTETSVEPRPGQPIADEAQLYRRFKARLVEEAPAILRVLVQKPELRVEVDVQTITIKGDSLRGRIARLIAAGFFDRGASGPGAQKELARLGSDPGPVVARELNEVAAMGFLTIEEGKDDRGRARKEYRAVEGMKINIVER
jgi:alanyl-tRNA synthetase